MNPFSRRRWCGLLFLSLLPVLPAWAAEPAAQTVRMIIDYGDGVELHFTALPWRQDMTVLDVVQSAQAHPRGIKFTWRGAGTTAFVTKVGEVANEGSGRTSKNWMYRVNGKEVDVGIGSRQLAAGDVILWKFQIYEYN